MRLSARIKALAAALFILVPLSAIGGERTFRLDGKQYSLIFPAELAFSARGEHSDGGEFLYFAKDQPLSLYVGHRRRGWKRTVTQTPEEYSADKAEVNGIKEIFRDGHTYLLQFGKDGFFGVGVASDSECGEDCYLYFFVRCYSCSPTQKDRALAIGRDVARQLASR